MLGQAIIGRKFSSFLILTASAFLSTACFTIVTVPKHQQVASVDASSIVGSETQSFDLTVTVEPVEGGMVTVTPLKRSAMGISEGSSASMASGINDGIPGPIAVYQVPQGMRVKLEAVPQEGYWFGSWRQRCVSVNFNACVLSINENTFAGASFLQLPVKADQPEN